MVFAVTSWETKRWLACFRALAVLVLLVVPAGAMAGRKQGALAPAAGHVRYGQPRQIATLADAHIDESSGLAAGRNRPGVFWTHNDSGDVARLYAFDRQGRRLATCTLAGVEADDWEDIASFRRGGRSFLLVADIGDNWWSRAECTLFLLGEPAVGTPEKPVTATGPVLQTIRFVYEGGPRDCEALGVDPATGRFYFVTKEGIRCKVFELAVPEETFAPPASGARPAPEKPYTARQVGEIATSPVVAMDIAPDGRRAIVLTYADALEFVRRGEETWPEAFARKPQTVVMPARRQGESICYGPDGRTLYLTSEHTPTPLLEVPVAADDWHHPLHLARGGYWRVRVPVRIENGADQDAAGMPLAVRIGKGEAEADLAGARAESVRVVTADGTDLLYDLRDADGRAVRKGPIPAGATLVLPAEAPAGGTVTYYVYVENPSAWAVAEYLEATVGVQNGGVERGAGGVPAGWQHDRGDEKHRAEWVGEKPHAGERCLRTTVAEGAEPSWIATRQCGIHVTGGTRYRLTGWVRAENVVGEAGWYVHLEPEKGSFLAAHHAGAGGGTYGWKQVTAEFTAPEKAVRASLGTVLRGTGTAWFDAVRLERLDPPRLAATPLPRETMDLRPVGGGQAWLDPAGAAAPRQRMAYRAYNFSAKDAAGGGADGRAGLVSVDLAALAGRLRAPLERGALVVACGKDVLEHVTVGDRLLFEADVPARSVCDYHVYAATAPAATGAAGPGDAAAAAADRAAYARLLASPRNMVRNPSFEAADGLPDAWTGGTEKPRAGGAAATLAEGGLFGERCVRIHVPEGAKAGWIGWHQAHAVRAGQTYLYAAWVKCEGISGSAVCLHAHCRTADGAMCKTGAYTSVGSPLEGTHGWTLLAGTLTMPPDGAKLELHLTMNARGTLWHDGVLLAAVQEAAPLGLQARRRRTPDGLAVWPVNPVVKVFRWDAPPEKPAPARLYAARNEAEPLQLAVRSPTGAGGVGVRVEVDPPKGPGGAVLDTIETAVVGYVPIDHPTSYYRSESPAWHRKYPRRPGRCDGWAGWWPDPLLPGKTFALESDRTQPVWVTVHVPKDAPAGDYRGAVRLVAGGGEKWRGGSPHPPRTGAPNEASAAGTETRRAQTGAAVLAEVPLTVHVWDFALPEEAHVKAIYDVRLHGRWWRDDIGGDRQAYLKRFWKFMAERRVSPNHIQPAPTIRYKNGKVEADFAAYDEAAAYYFDVLGLPHTYTPWQFYCFGWGHPPRTMCGEAPYPGAFPYEGADRSQLRPEYKRAYQACLRAYWNHMKEKGWADRVVLYISDEPHDRRHEYVVQQMKALCAMIHEVDPAIPIYSSTWHHQPAWDGSLDVWGVGHQGRTPVDTMRAIRRRGDTLWFTTDGEMCTDTPYCAVERLLPHYCFHWGAEAYEFWGVDWLTYNPYDYGWHAYIHQSDRPGSSYYVRYPNGDGYLAYPGSPMGREGPVSSIRLEQAREGVEDYEYLTLLQQRIAAAKKAGRATAEAEAVLDEAAGLVTIPNPGGRYATRILPDPDAVLRLKERVARAIEALSE